MKSFHPDTYITTKKKHQRQTFQKKKLPKTMQTIKLSLSITTEMFLRTLIGLKILTEIDKSHETALFFGNKCLLRFGHEQILK
jgi:hypothetical protein